MDRSHLIITLTIILLTGTHLVMAQDNQFSTDEQPDTTSSTSTTPSSAIDCNGDEYFVCTSGYNIWPSGDYANLTCVPFENVCDRAEHCLDGSDEMSCNYTTTTIEPSTTEHPACLGDHFLCENGLSTSLDPADFYYASPCIDSSAECDGYQNCTDGSDELDCPDSETSTTTPTTTTTATTPTPTTGVSQSSTTPIQTTAFIFWTTPSLDNILEDLGLDLDLGGGGNSSEEAEPIGLKVLTIAMDSALEGNATVPASTLFGFATALSQATSGPATEETSLDEALDTCGKIFDAAGGASTDDLANIAKGVVSVIGNVLDAALATPVPSSSNDGSNSNSSTPEESSEDLVSNTLNVLDKVATAITNTMSPSDPPIAISTASLGMSIAVVDQAGAKMNAGFAKIELEGTPTSALPLQVLSYAEDPFASFATNSDNFTSGASPVGIRVVGSDNQTLEYKAESQANFSLPVTTYEVGEASISANFEITDKESYLKVFLTLPSSVTSHTLWGALGEEPTDNNHTLRVDIVDSLNITRNDLNITLDYTQAPSSLSDDSMYLFLNVRKLNFTGYFYLKYSANGIADAITTPTPSRRKRSAGTTFSTSGVVYTPRVWNETSKAWETSEDVEVDPESTGEKVVFKSNFMGSMTSGLIIPPNKIDFDTVFDDLGAKTAENPYVLIVVCLIAALYFILLIPIVRFDRRDYKMWEFLPILHNEPQDRYIYQISVSVNKKSSKEFNTQVFCVLYGMRGKTTPKTLDDGKRQNFLPGRPTNLTVTCQEDIGAITHVHIWTKARDERDSLYVDWITVADPELKKSYTFICNDWISPVHTEGYGHEIYSTGVQDGSDFVSLFKSNTKNKVFDDHLWLSVVRRPNKSNFSRVQRWSLCIATLYLTMVVNAMFFPTSPEEDDETSATTLKIGPIDLSWRTIYVSFMGAVIVLPPTMLITFFFQRSRPLVPPSKKRKVEQEREARSPVNTDQVEDKEIKRVATPSVKNLKLFDVSTPRLGNSPPPPPYEEQLSDQELRDLQKKNNASFTFPWYGVVFGYILCGICIANGVWWPYLYSIQWGKDLSLEWLATLVFSIFQSIIVLQPIKVIIIVVIMSFLLQNTLGEPDELSMINTVSDLHGSVKPVESIEPPIMPQKIVRPDPIVIQVEAQLYKKLFDKLKGTLAHILYLILLILVVSHNTSTSFFLQNKTIKDTLELNEIGLGTIEEIWPYLRETVFPNVFPTHHYNGDWMSEYDKQFMYNIDGLRMGPVRMKQNRDINKECDEYLRYLASYKFSLYDCEPQEDERNWNARWNGTHSDSGVTNPPYIHEVIKGSKYRGNIDSYSLGGYTVTMYDSNWNLVVDLLESEIWMDKLTRAVFVELVIANMNVNVFSQIKIVFETPVYGGVFVWYTVDSFRPYPYVDWIDFLFLILQCIWFLLLCYIIFKEAKAMHKLGWRSYIKEPWHVVESLNVTLALTSIVFFAMRSYKVVKTVEFMKNNPNEYVDFDPVMRWDTAYSLTIALVLFIAIIQLYQPMDFSKQLTALKMALKETGPRLIMYSVTFMLLLLLFSHVMTISFGDQFGAFVDFMRSFYYLFGMLLGILRYSDVVESDMTMLRLMFTIFMVAGNFILLNMFISVINEGLSYMHENPEKAEFDVELSEYLKDKLTGWWYSLTGRTSKPKFARVRRGGPWNKELELYYSLLEEREISPLEEKEVVLHQAQVDVKADTAVDWFDAIASDRLTETEKAHIPVSEEVDRKECTVRLAIKTIIWDMLLSNNKMSDFMARQSTPIQDDEAEDYQCLSQTGGRIGADGGRLEVMPGTWMVIHPGTFDYPTFVSVQAFTSSLFASYIVELEAESPLKKPFKVCLPFKDGKRRDYCNVFAQRDDGPWTLAYNSVTCFSESLWCMCQPRGDERKFRVAAKATKKSATKAGVTLDAEFVSAQLVSALMKEEDEEKKEAVTEMVVHGAADKWRKLKKGESKERVEKLTKVYGDQSSKLSDLELL